MVRLGQLVCCVKKTRPLDVSGGGSDEESPAPIPTDLDVNNFKTQKCAQCDRGREDSILRNTGDNSLTRRGKERFNKIKTKETRRPMLQGREDNIRKTED